MASLRSCFEKGDDGLFHCSARGCSKSYVERCQIYKHCRLETKKDQSSSEHSQICDMIPEQILQRRHFSKGRISSRLSRRATNSRNCPNKQPGKQQFARKQKDPKPSKKTSSNRTSTKSKRTNKAGSSMIPRLQNSKPPFDALSSPTPFPLLPESPGTPNFNHALPNSARGLTSPGFTPSSNIDFKNDHTSSGSEMPFSHEPETCLLPPSPKSPDFQDPVDPPQGIHKDKDFSSVIAFEKPSIDLYHFAETSFPSVYDHREDCIHVSKSNCISPKSTFLSYEPASIENDKRWNTIQTQTHGEDYPPGLQPSSHALPAPDPNIEHPQPTRNIFRSFSLNCNDQRLELSASDGAMVGSAAPAQEDQNVKDTPRPICIPSSPGLGLDTHASQTESLPTSSLASPLPCFYYMPQNSRPAVSSKEVCEGFIWPSQLIAMSARSEPGVTLTNIQYQDSMSDPLSSTSNHDNSDIITLWEAQVANSDQNEAAASLFGLRDALVGSDQFRNYDNDVFLDCTWEALYTIPGDGQIDPHLQPASDSDAILGRHEQEHWAALKEIFDPEMVESNVDES